MDVVEYGYNGAAAEAGINRLKSQAVSLNEAFGRVGQSADFSHPFLRSESRVSRSAANMVGNMLQVNNATDAVALALQSFERATHLGLGLAIGLAVGISAFEAIKKQIEETKKVEEEFRKVTERPLNLQLGLSVGDMGKQIADQEKENAALQAREGTKGNVIAALFDPANLKRAVGAGDLGAVFELFRGAEAKLDKQDEEAAAGANKVNTLIKARAALELENAKIHERLVNDGGEENSLAKVQLELQQKIKALKLEAVDNPNLKAGLQDRIEAAKIEEKLQEKALIKKTDEGDVKDLIQFQDDEAASQIANYQGTKQEKEDFSTARNKERLQNEIDILHAYGMQEQEKKKILELDELTGKAGEQKKAETEKNDAEVKAATTSNQVTALQQGGQTFAASILKIREATEAKIAAHLRDQKGELAVQDKIAGQLELREKLKEQLRNPQGAAARERAAAQEDTGLDAKIKYYQDQVSRGVRFDKDDPTAKYIQQYLDAKKTLDQTGGGQKDDFSSVASLAGKDFSSLSKLGEADFSGLQALANLQIKIQ